ncbi:hypothetical protein BJY01DRAFT_18929 [Aspergillus pseudoustus]|uniref:Uncharacterized protein n=1 Tax=Aspergillus pseudoustus TaxID=1810923 RepID=A0ABR4KRQ5_9EURO
MLRLAPIPCLPPFRRPVARGKAGWPVARSRTKPRFPFPALSYSSPFNLALLPPHLLFLSLSILLHPIPFLLPLT